MKFQLVQDKHYYYNQEGYMVFTEAYHLEKGYCCGHGCLHCPFDYECVPEPKRSILIEMREENNSLAAKKVTNG